MNIDTTMCILFRTIETNAVITKELKLVAYGKRGMRATEHYFYVQSIY